MATSSKAPKATAEQIAASQASHLKYAATLPPAQRLLIEGVANDAEVLRAWGGLPRSRTKTTFPKPRPRFCNLADGTPVYFYYRWCAQITRPCTGLGLDRIQTEECMADDFATGPLLGMTIRESQDVNCDEFALALKARLETLTVTEVRAEIERQNAEWRREHEARKAAG